MAADPYDVFYVAVGSSYYVEPTQPELSGFSRIPGANKSARLVAAMLDKAGAHFGVTVTSSTDAYVGIDDINSAVDRVTEEIESRRPDNPLLIFYFAGHGVSEGVGWNLFLVPGNFLYRGELRDLEALAESTLTAGELVERIERQGVPFLILLDNCYEADEANFASPVLNDEATRSLRFVADAIRYMNQFHGSNPVFFSTPPGTTVPTVADPTDPKSQIKVGRLARRLLIYYEQMLRVQSEFNLGDFVTAMASADLDINTSGATTYAQLDSPGAPLARYDETELGAAERREGTAANAVVCCGEPASIGLAMQTSWRATLALDGDNGEYVTDGQSFKVAARPEAITVQQYRPGDLEIYIDDGIQHWSLGFAAPHGEPFRLGTYANTARYGFQDDASPGLSIKGNGRACNDVRGSFTVRDAEYNQDGYLQLLVVEFQQFCDDVRAPLNGYVELQDADLGNK